MKKFIYWYFGIKGEQHSRERKAAIVLHVLALAMALYALIKDELSIALVASLLAVYIYLVVYLAYTVRKRKVEEKQ